jgi:hypothetical protein
MLIPAAGASASDVSAAYNKKEKKAEKKQNARITKVVKAGAKLAKTVADQSTKIAGANAAILAEGAKSNGIDDRLKVIEGAAPQIIKGLGDLKDGLTALKTGLETAGAGLTSLKTLATSQEYGFGQVITIQSPGPPPVSQPEGFVETPDIPDTVQQAQTSQTFEAANAGAIAVLYGVRSNETDGTGASNPAALCKVSVTSGGTTQTTAANPAIGNQRFQPVPDKSAMTSTDAANQTFPFGLKSTGADADKTTTFPTSIVVGAGDEFTVSMSCLDLSPSTTDPSA